MASPAPYACKSTKGTNKGQGSDGAEQKLGGGGKNRIQVFNFQVSGDVKFGLGVFVKGVVHRRKKKNS